MKNSEYKERANSMFRHDNTVASGDLPARRFALAGGSQTGFTLIEVTLAMVILVVAILSALMVIITCVQQREVSHEMDLAKNAVVAKLQEIRAYDFDTIHAQYNKVDGPRRVFVIWELRPIPGFGGVNGFTNVDNTNPELLEIIVNVQWLSVTQAEQNLTVRSMVTRTE